MTELEVRTYTIGCGNTSPRADGIYVELLSACWNHIKSHVIQLLRAFLRLGFHPACFKLAEVIFLPKAGRDPSSIKGWRPISLLSCLGKGLGRILAMRMSHLAIVWNIVGQQQFGALPKRSATDLVSCVVHVIEGAKTQGWASTFVTLDVQGAFDAVLHNRPTWRMQAQRWPKQILPWTSSFLKSRKFQVRFSGGVTIPKELVFWVLQGSRISPLLFLLYMAKPMRSGNVTTRFSYTDDIGVLGLGRTMAASAVAAQREVDNLSNWAYQNAVLFDPEKSESVQFPGRKK